MEEKSYPQMRKEFQDLFFNDISLQLQNYEDTRKKKLFLAMATLIICVIIGLFILSASFVFMITTKNKEADICLQLGIAMFVLGGMLWTLIKKRFERSVKREIMPIVCKCFGDLTWESSLYKGNKNIFLDSNLIKKYTFEEYDDIFSGTYCDVAFEMIESKFTKQQGKNQETIFKGVIIKLDMNKRFNGNTVILPDAIGHASPDSKLRHTTLEDVEFEKQFDVFTDDEVEARYLITPSFMERLKNMRVAFAASGVQCAFYGKYLLIGLKTNKDLFSLCSLVKPVNDAKQFFTMYEEIISIIKLIDHFKLDRKIGL